MFRSRFVRLGVMALGVLGLLGVGTPPAQARTESTLTFTGKATLDGPLGYPCVDGPPPPTGITKCPTTGIGTTKPLTLPGDSIDQGSLPFVAGGNTRTGTFHEIVCVNTVYNFMKPLPKHNNIHVSNVNGGPCTITAPTVTVTGWCGLSTGLATGSFTDALGNMYSFRIHFYGVASELVVTGHWTKPGSTQTGKVVGAVNAVPVPSTVPLLGDVGSCTNKTATQFTVTGAIAAVTT